MKHLSIPLLILLVSVAQAQHPVDLAGFAPTYGGFTATIDTRTSVTYQLSAWDGQTTTSTTEVIVGDDTRQTLRINTGAKESISYQVLFIRDGVEYDLDINGNVWTPGSTRPRTVDCLNIIKQLDDLGGDSAIERFFALFILSLPEAQREPAKAKLRDAAIQTAREYIDAKKIAADMEAAALAARAKAALEAQGYPEQGE